MQDKTFTRRFVPLLPGEKQKDYTSAGFPIPDGYREETDKEFRERIKKALGDPSEKCNHNDFSHDEYGNIISLKDKPDCTICGHKLWFHDEDGCYCPHGCHPCDVDKVRK